MTEAEVQAREQAAFRRGFEAGWEKFKQQALDITDGLSGNCEFNRHYDKSAAYVYVGNRLDRLRPPDMDCL